jgi:hypothetical protein
MRQQLTWIFLHCFAEKINENIYVENKEECFNFLLKIYGNMNCDMCSTHSIIYLNNNKQNIETKDKLINYLFEFHNIVNLKLRKKVFEKEILQKYKCANIENIFMNYTSRMTHNEYITEFLEKNKSWF